MNDSWVNRWKSRGASCLQPRQALIITVLILLLGFPLEDIMRERSVLRHGFMDDFSLSYYPAARLASQPGVRHLYDPVLKQGLGTDWSARPFITPPSSALLLEPLARLTVMQAYMAWRYILALMTALALYFVLRTALEDQFSVAALAIGVAATFSFHPYQYMMFLGNIDAIILLAWALGLYWFARGRPVASAFCFALGSVVKLAPAIAVPLMLIRRQWRWLGAYAGWVLALTGISIWRLGWQPYHDWITAVYPVISHGTLSFYNRSLPGLILFCAPGQVWGRPGSLGWEVKLPAILCSLGFYFWCWKKSRGSQGLVLELALAPLVYVLTSPVAWTFHFILGLIPLAYLWAKSQDPEVSASRGEIGVLAGVSILWGVAAPNYLAGGLNNFYFSLLIMSLWVVATVTLIGLGMRMYTRCLTNTGKIAEPKPSRVQFTPS